MIDVFTLAHILSAVVLWIIFKKKWQYVILIFIGWEMIEIFILSYLHPIFQETFIDTAMDVIIESAVYFLLVACAWRIKMKKDRSGKTYKLDILIPVAVSIIGLGLIVGSFGILFEEIWFPFESEWTRAVAFFIVFGFGIFLTVMFIPELYRVLKNFKRKL